VIRVLVVDDSPFFRRAFSAFLESDPDLTVAATAENGREAVELVERLRPDIVTMDVNMPVMNGYEAVEQIMARCPVPIVIVTGSPSKQEKHAVLDALALGALDVVPKPDLKQCTATSLPVLQLIQKLKELSRAHVVRHVAGLMKERDKRSADGRRSKRLARVVAIAASTGGPAALARLFAPLPADLAAAIVVVQHITEGFTDTLVEWLDSTTGLQVRLAQPREPLSPATALIAPGNRHMRVDSTGRVHLLDLPPVRGYKPCADILLSSVAEAFGHRAIGVILTGMGNDGVEGLKTIRQRGGTTIAQDQGTCAVFGMPRAAIEADLVDAVLPPEGIADKIARLVAADSPRTGR